MAKRPHTKSRRGCNTCKSRRIRCDENFPQCKNCTKQNVHCPYMDRKSTPEKLDIPQKLDMPWANQTPPLILPSHKQNLLLVTLNSNRPTKNVQQNNATMAIAQNSFDNTSPLQVPGSGALTNLDESPFISYNYNFNSNAIFSSYNFSNLPQGQMIGNLPGTSSDGDAPTHNKRGFDEEEKEDEPEGKRREGEEMISKKRGRISLTSELKRRAQNRAAQCTYRERKEKYLRDLETKIQDLKMASEAANYENLILRKRVETMTAVLMKYERAGMSWQIDCSSHTDADTDNVPRALSQSTPHNPNINYSFESPRSASFLNI